MSFFCLCKASPDGSEDGPITRRRTAACNPEALLSNINTAALRSRPGRQVDLLAEARRPRSPPPFQMHQPGAKGNLAEQRLWTVLRRSGLKGSDSFLTRPGGSVSLSRLQRCASGTPGYVLARDTIGIAAPRTVLALLREEQVALVRLKCPPPLSSRPWPKSELQGLKRA